MDSKKLTILFFMVSVFTGCKEIDELLTFRINDETRITIQSASPLNLPLSIPTPEITTNSNQRFQNNNTRADLVKDVKLEELTLAISSPASKTFSFLKSIHIYISTDEFDESEIAYMDNVTTTSSSIALTPVNIKLDKYVKSDTYKLRTQIVTKETLTEDVEVKVGLQFRVTARSL